MKYKKGQPYGSLCTEIVTEDESRVVAVVWTHKPHYDRTNDKHTHIQCDNGMKIFQTILDALNAEH